MTSPDVFLHLPRTGGTTLWGILRRVYGQNGVLRLLHGTMPDNTHALREALTTYDGSYRLVGGHFYFDPELASYPCFTMLRRPANRAISTYYKIIRREQHRMHDEFIRDNVTLLDSLERMPHNLQTRLIAGVRDDDIVTAEHLELAKSRLHDNFRAVGLTEQFDKSLILFKRTFDWPMPYYDVRNSSKNRPKEIPDAVYEQADAINAFDVELYAYAEALFAHQVAGQGETFEHDLQALRAGRPQPQVSLWQRLGRRLKVR